MIERPPAPVWEFSQFASLVPARGWIHNYLNYAIQCTDAPPIFHILSSIVLVALAIASDHVLQVHGEDHPLHFFMLLVGSSGSRKSAAIKRAIRVVQPCLARRQIGHRIWYPEVCSVEGIYDGLVSDPCRLMVASEWTDLHNLHKATYAQHAREMFNLLYDGSPLTRLRAGKDPVVIANPCVSILGASTPSLVKGSTSVHDWGAGKLARYLIGCQDKPDDMEMVAAVDHPHLVTALQVEYDYLLAATVGRSFVLSQDAWDAKVYWEKHEQWASFRKTLPEHLQPSALRVSEHLYRIATIYQASIDYPHSTVVSGEAMERAIALVWYCLQSMVEVFTLLPSDEKNPILRTSQVLKMYGNTLVTHHELLRRTGLTAKQLAEALGTLQARRELVVTASNGALQYRWREA